MISRGRKLRAPNIIHKKTLFSSFLFEFYIIFCREILKKFRIYIKISKTTGFQDRGEGYVIGSYSSLGFRALWKDVDWTLTETAEHLSGH